jgi:hypothetical protein
MELGKRVVYIDREGALYVFLGPLERAPPGRVKLELN